MAKKRPSMSPSRSVTPERAARLFLLIQLVGRSPQTRQSLIRRLGLDIRGFYRDLELLRDSRISLAVRNQRYVLEVGLDDAVSRLPFPDPCLTVGEALELARGRSAAHRKLKALLGQFQQPRR
jgi:hypothetical protein